MENSERQDVSTARDASWLFIMNISIAAGGIVYFSFAARLLPTSADLGILAFITMLAMLLNTFGVFALPQAVVRFLADLKAKQNIPGGRAFFRLMIILGSVCAVGSAIFLVIFSGPLSFMFLGSNVGIFYVSLLSLDIIPTILRNFFHRALIGERRIKRAGIAGVVGGVSRSVIAIIMLLNGYGIAGIIVGWTVGDSIDFILCFYWSSRGYLEKGESSITRQQLVAFTGPLYLSNVLNYLNSTIDRYVLLLLLGTSALGMYSPALTAISMISLLPTSVSSALFPRFSEIASIGDNETLKIGARVAYRWLYLIYLPITFAVAIEANYVVDIIAGPGYADAAPILSILAIASGLTCPTVIFGSILMGQGRTRALFLAKGSVLITGLAASFLLIIPLQLLGVAFARTIVFAVELLVLGATLRMREDISFDVSALSKPLLSSIVTVAVLFVLQTFWNYFILLPLYFILAASLYVLMLRLLHAVDYSDIEFIQMLLPARFSPMIDYFGDLLVAGPKPSNNNPIPHKSE